MITGFVFLYGIARELSEVPYFAGSQEQGEPYLPGLLLILPVPSHHCTRCFCKYGKKLLFNVIFVIEQFFSGSMLSRIPFNAFKDNVCLSIREFNIAWMTVV